MSNESRVLSSEQNKTTTLNDKKNVKTPDICVTFNGKSICSFNWQTKRISKHVDNTTESLSTPTNKIVHDE